MGKKKNRGKKKNGHETTVTKLVLITALIQLFTAFLDLIKKLLE